MHPSFSYPARTSWLVNTTMVEFFKTLFKYGNLLHLVQNFGVKTSGERDTLRCKNFLYLSTVR
jgi:hypothetical protein